MDFSPIDSVPVPSDAGPTGILLSRDLIFTSKVTGTARELGHRVLVAGTSSLALVMIEQWQPRVVFVDLSAGDLVAPRALLNFQRLAGPATAFLAFGSHVDTEGLATAVRSRLRPRHAPEQVLRGASRIDWTLFVGTIGLGDGSVCLHWLVLLRPLNRLDIHYMRNNA